MNKTYTIDASGVVVFDEKTSEELVKQWDEKHGNSTDKK